MDTDARDDAERSHDIIRCSQRRAQTDGLNDGICPTTVGQFRDPASHTGRIGREVERLGSQLLRQGKTAIYAVDGEQVLGLVFQGGYYGAKTNGTASDHDHDGFGRRLLEQSEGVLGAEEARREDVGHEHQGFVTELRRCLVDGTVGVWDADILGFPSRSAFV